MAIHPQFPGVVVNIVVENQPLCEYDDPDSPSSRNISKYVQSEAGKDFGIRCTIGKQFVSEVEAPMLAIEIYINNKRCTLKCITKGVLEAMDPYVVKITGVLTNEDEESIFRPFQFVEIQRSEDHVELRRVNIDKEVMKEVGSIVVEFWACNKVEAEGSATTTATGIHALYMNAGTVIHEKALNGEPIYDNVTLGHAKTVAKAAAKTKIEKIGLDPIFAFKFEYRSKLALKHLMVIPRSPSPDLYSDDTALNTESSNPNPGQGRDQGRPRADELTPAQRRMVAEFSRQQAEELTRHLLSENAKIKREREGDELDNVSSKQRKANTNTKEVVDLPDE